MAWHAEGKARLTVVYLGYAKAVNNADRNVISQLRAELNEVKFERYSLVSFEGKPVMRRGFFPGGNGLFEGDKALRLPVGRNADCRFELQCVVKLLPCRWASGL